MSDKTDPKKWLRERAWVQTSNGLCVQLSSAFAALDIRSRVLKTEIGNLKEELMSCRCILQSRTLKGPTQSITPEGPIWEGSCARGCKHVSEGAEYCKDILDFVERVAKDDRGREDRAPD
jgi:hypothetical protein